MCLVRGEGRPADCDPHRTDASGTGWRDRWSRWQGYPSIGRPAPYSHRRRVRWPLPCPHCRKGSVQPPRGGENASTHDWRLVTRSGARGSGQPVQYIGPSKRLLYPFRLNVMKCATWSRSNSGPKRTKRTLVTTAGTSPFGSVQAFARCRGAGSAYRPRRAPTAPATTGRSCGTGCPGVRIGGTPYAGYHIAGGRPAVVDPASCGVPARSSCPGWHALNLRGQNGGALLRQTSSRIASPAGPVTGRGANAPVHPYGTSVDAHQPVVPEGRLQITPSFVCRHEVHVEDEVARASARPARRRRASAPCTQWGWPPTTRSAPARDQPPRDPRWIGSGACVYCVPQCGSTTTTSTRRASRRTSASTRRGRRGRAGRCAAACGPSSAPGASGVGRGRLADRVEADEAEASTPCRSMTDRPPRLGQVAAGAERPASRLVRSRSTVLHAGPRRRSRRCGCWPAQTRRTRRPARPAGTAGRPRTSRRPAAAAPSADSVLSRLPTVRSARPAGAHRPQRSDGSPAPPRPAPTRRPSMMSPTTVSVVTAAGAGPGTRSG